MRSKIVNAVRNLRVAFGQSGTTDRLADLMDTLRGPLLTVRGAG